VNALKTAQSYVVKDVGITLVIDPKSRAIGLVLQSAIEGSCFSSFSVVLVRVFADTMATPL
jgi:hypothetical protein